MSYQTRAFKISFLFHGLIIALILILGPRIGPSKKMMVLDFQLSKTESLVKKDAPPPPLPIPQKKEMKSSAPETFKKNEPQRPMDAKSEAASSPEIAPVVALPESQNPGGGSLGLGMIPASMPVKEGRPGIPGESRDASGTGQGKGQGGNPGPDGGKESARMRYLKEHFAYIRDRILSNVIYPIQARRMGWQGKTVLSFVIASDGSVREVKIVQSSGFPVLDKNAMETVSDTAPFPKPPVEAQLVLPVIYRLE